MIRFLVMDVDGTLTNGKLYMSAEGEVMKVFNIKDGCGIREILPRANIIPVIITGRSSDIVTARCRELGIEEVYQGVSDKLEKLVSLIYDLSEAAYIGDDINDIPCMEAVRNVGGVVGCPQDAAVAVRLLADYIADHDGGSGAVRSFIEWLVEYNNKH